MVFTEAAAENKPGGQRERGESTAGGGGEAKKCDLGGMGVCDGLHTRGISKGNACNRQHL